LPELSDEDFYESQSGVSCKKLAVNKDISSSGGSGTDSGM